MRRRSNTLIDEIERGALDPKVPISTPLRKLVALGGQAGSAELREWASLELRGYVESDTPLPAYRKPGAVLRIDGGTFNAMITVWVPETRIRVVIRSRTALGDGCQDSREIASSSRRQLLFAQTRGRA
jgi:hypothetical protein